MNTFSQLPAEKKYSKNGAAGKFFGPSYFDPALIQLKDGTVGAAASSIELVALSASLSLPKKVDINKPFLFFVRDTDLNAIVFAGKYADPDQ